ncbi:ubiquinone/menaquinone biosynthesis methyltransferase [Desulfobaculum bizertense]|uniref:Demethylmenaquinone methyltransferase n=1 Tax=Desulfobaculum bizertense DSM 18034 TaxID=1121442 RepID=A0A1T4WTV2_9BACT|nr:ubiquinone/menaquinone biosynthesis methyltransferase [Desulfobaculum bizertense]SKA80295.1 demethylmenaquinone methyltransferase / 2-methoxy-6-polyprenyl-1,4-benzoquinol methylase [Desulfobaculum bizertense DSM 18034]
MQQPDPSHHAGRVAGMFGRIAGWYDFLNHFLSLGQDIYWRHRLVRMLRPGPTGRVLDLAAGTLDVSLEIKRQFPKSKVLSLDFTEAMLQKGQTKLKTDSGRDIQPVLADGRTLPLPTACVDNVTIAFGIRNIRPRMDAYREMYRVLVPGGRMCILEFGSGQNKIWKGLYNVYLDKILPSLGKIFSGDKDAYTYLAETIDGFPVASELVSEITEAGFERVFYVPLLSGIVNIHVAEKSINAEIPVDEETPEEPFSTEDIELASEGLAAGLAAYEKAIEQDTPKKTAAKKKAPAKKAAPKPKKPAAKKAAPKKKASSTAKSSTAKKNAVKKSSAAKSEKKGEAKPAKKSTAKKKTTAKASSSTSAKSTAKKTAAKKTSKKAATKKATASKQEKKLEPAAKTDKKSGGAAKKKTAAQTKKTTAVKKTATKK